jgi:hypothetical protein
MKIKQAKCIAITAVLAASCNWFSGCASAPKDQQNEASQTATQENASLTKEAVLSQPDVKGHPPVVFAKNVGEVQQAGVRALTFVGCEIKTQEPLFVSGHRPNKFGLFVGSGGETVNVYLYPQSETETHVWVETHKSFVGLAGQQGWNKQVIDQMTQILSNPTAAK